MSLTFSQPGVCFEVPHSITHVSVGAHPDDLEFMSLHGILECRRRATRGYLGVVAANGVTSNQVELGPLRKSEQEEAARIGRYGGLLQLNFQSAPLKQGVRHELVSDLLKLFSALENKLEVVYTHNLGDKHDTHVAVSLSVLEALNQLPPEKRPARVLGCEVWRSLDWLVDYHRLSLDVSDGEELLDSLTKVYRSQNQEKRYDLAVLGRKRVNATFGDPYAPDTMKLCEWMVDLTPLIDNPSLENIEADLSSKISALQLEMIQRLRRLKSERL